MLERDIVVSNKLGLHARASAKLVQLVQGFKATVWLVSKGREVNAQSIMGVMMLAAGIGTPLDRSRRWSGRAVRHRGRGGAVRSQVRRRSLSGERYGTHMSS